MSKHKWRKLVFSNAHEPRECCSVCGLIRERFSDKWQYGKSVNFPEVTKSNCVEITDNLEAITQ